MTDLSFVMLTEPADFRCRPTATTTQPCTFCGAPGYYSVVGYEGPYVPPGGHTVRSNGTLSCPRSLSDTFDAEPGPQSEDA